MGLGLVETSVVPEGLDWQSLLARDGDDLEVHYRHVLRTNMRVTLEQNPLSEEHLRDFVTAFAPDDRSARVESERFHHFGYDDLTARDKLSLDLTWLRDESLEDMDNLPPPDVIARGIVEDLEAALAEFATIADSLAPQDAAEPSQ